ncbi:Neurotactin [Eumeta japonica]|uniref:Neurotactin n=1 Tax=Eumeta variegata TaxID=151549 RepID=A0A4C1Y1E9_EUMVA|nr:Neurotactin [Eumeta japonica]
MDQMDVNKIENEEENKTPDKKQIEAEEKETMLKTDDPENVDLVLESKPMEGEGPVKAALSGSVTDEGREVKPKFIPIGAIKMPGFFTRNTDKDKSKEEEAVASDIDRDKSAEGVKPKRHRLQFLHTCPFTQFLHHPQNQDDIVVCGIALLVLLAVIIGVIIGASAGPPAERPLRAGRFMTTITTCGPVEGILQDGVYKFYGIPYAVPPVGEQRFTYARPLNNISLCWNETLPLHEPKPVCLQFSENGTIFGEEDCLTIDIVTPHVRYDSPLPVVVLIGANSLAGGISPLQPSAMYSRTKEVVFVKPNFRLGPFGFLALDVLSRSKYPPTSGNYALSDLLVALQWVKNNIKHFGGDADSVTLLAHRGGATLAAALTTMKKAQKLYSRVWLSSPSVIYPGKLLDEVHNDYDLFKQRTSCDDANCLKKISTMEILTATPDIWLENSISKLPHSDETQKSWLVLDGDLLRMHPYEVWNTQMATRSGLEKDKDTKLIIFGTTQHSAHTELLRMKNLNWTSQIVEEMVSSSVIGEKNLTAAVFSHFNKTYKGLVELISAIRTLCPLVSLARIRLEAPMYVATGAGAGAGIAGLGMADINADVEAILGTFDSDTPEQRRYMSAMQHLFYYFVWNGHLPGIDSKLIAVGQDPLPLRDLPACNLLIEKDIVPRYAHID